MKQKAKSQSIKKKKKENHLGVIEWKAGAPSNDFSGDKSAGRVWGPQQILAVWHVPCEGSSLSLSLSLLMGSYTRESCLQGHSYCPKNLFRIQIFLELCLTWDIDQHGIHIRADISFVET